MDLAMGEETRTSSKDQHLFPASIRPLGLGQDLRGSTHVSPALVSPPWPDTAPALGLGVSQLCTFPRLETW